MDVKARLDDMLYTSLWNSHFVTIFSSKNVTSLTKQQNHPICSPDQPLARPTSASWESLNQNHSGERRFHPQATLWKQHPFQSGLFQYIRPKGHNIDYHDFWVIYHFNKNAFQSNANHLLAQQYELHKIWRTFSLWPWYVTLTILMICNNIQTIKCVEISNIIIFLIWPWPWLLTLMWPWPWCVTLTLLMTFSNIQRINIMK